MKGVVLAGGKGTRLNPLTATCNKHLLMVGREPMIFNPIKQLVSAGIIDILITSSEEHIGDISKLVGDGSKLGCKATYKVQHEPKGIAHALLLAEDFAEGDMIAVILGDNITTHSIKPYVEEFKRQGIGAKVLLKEVQNPSRYGIAIMEENCITAIVEKPRKFISNLAVTGIYFYDSKVFNIIKDTSLSKKGELGISPVNNAYLKLKQLTYNTLAGQWADAGTIESLKYANELLMKVDNKIIISEEVKINDFV